MNEEQQEALPRTPNKPDVYETRRFSKALDRLHTDVLQQVEDEIDKIIAEPTIGEQKKGDLKHLWVHKFVINEQLYLLGYSWVEDKLVLYLMTLGSHENFYDEQKKHRKKDLKDIEKLLK
ncbi:type II toxin-antitoxin system RelE/ParE family toxin [Serratia sp. D1N4]